MSEGLIEVNIIAERRRAHRYHVPMRVSIMHNRLMGMGDPLFLLAAAGLSLSGIVSAIKLIDWFLHSDPKLIAQTGRWAVLGLAVLCLPLLIGLLFAEKWTAALALAAAMLLVIWNASSSHYMIARISVEESACGECRC